jgi:hypothetical protein
MATYIKGVHHSDASAIDLDKVLIAIKEGKWESPISKIRTLKEEGREDEASKLKLSLPAFTVSAEYKGERRKLNISRYLGYVNLDYDKLDDPNRVKSVVASLPFTYSAFISPSGNGVKVIVKIDSDLDQHEDAFKSVREYYDTVVGIRSDEKVKDVLRLCFVSHDPELYLNDSVHTYMLPIANGGKSKPTLEWLSDFTSKVVQFAEGSRNQFVHQLACNANRYGIDKYDLLQYCSTMASTGFGEVEIRSTINGAYERNASEFNSRAIFSGSETTTATTASTSFSSSTTHVEDTPYIPEWIFDMLPEPFKKITSLFGGRERDIVLMSVLSTVSGALNVHGKYGKERIRPNLYTLVMANAASGKGVLKYSRHLVQPYHDELKTQSELEHREWQRKVSAKKKKGDNGESGYVEKPLQRVYLLPGDTSTSKLLEHLQGLDGFGCIHETESDTIGKTLKKEHSNYSDVLRKAFHGESVSISRREDSRFTEIKEPKFSATISGTPGQFAGIVKSIEDGLVSRMMIYTFHRDAVWRSTFFEDDENTLEREIASLSLEVSRFLSAQVEREVRITKEQGARRDAFFSVHYPRLLKEHGEELASVVTRLAVSSHKIAMVLAAFRSNESVIIVDDRDFDIGLTIATEVLLPHSIAFLKPLIMRKSRSEQQLSDRLLNLCPEKFQTRDLYGSFEELNVSRRTGSELLKKLVAQGLLIKNKRGDYERPTE